MSYRTFDGYHKGYSHVKSNMECEDYAISYADPEGRFFIGIICDGHSDKNCFRSAKGAKYGCLAGQEMICRFFEEYYRENIGRSGLLKDAEVRLKKGIMYKWYEYLSKDINANPLTEKELAPLSERVRDYYLEGRGLENIFGATFLAVAVCSDFFMAMHIGDGEMLCVSEDGTYKDPLPEDEKSSTGSPASLCDSDLFIRPEAFRSKIYFDSFPIGAIVSSDGIGDCMNGLGFKEFTNKLLKEVKGRTQDGTPAGIISSQAQQYIDECVAYYAREGVGVEDDCSIAGFYLEEAVFGDVKIPLDEAEAQYKDAVKQYDDMVRDYETRKQKIIADIKKQNRDVIAVIQRTRDIDYWVTQKEKIEDLKRVLQNVDKNEHDKAVYYKQQLEASKEYARRAGSRLDLDATVLKMETIPDEMMNPDEELLAYKKDGTRPEIFTKIVKSKISQPQPVKQVMSQVGAKTVYDTVSTSTGIPGFGTASNSSKHHSAKPVNSVAVSIGIETTVDETVVVQEQTVVSETVDQPVVDVNSDFKPINFLDMEVKPSARDDNADDDEAKTQHIADLTAEQQEANKAVLDIAYNEYVEENGDPNDLKPDGSDPI